MESCCIRLETFLSTVFTLNCELGMEQRTAFVTKRSGFVTFDVVSCSVVRVSCFNLSTLEFVVYGFLDINSCLYEYFALDLRT